MLSFTTREATLWPAVWAGCLTHCHPELEFKGIFLHGSGSGGSENKLRGFQVIVLITQPVLTIEMSRLIWFLWECHMCISKRKESRSSSERKHAAHPWRFPATHLESSLHGQFERVSGARRKLNQWRNRTGQLFRLADGKSHRFVMAGDTQCLDRLTQTFDRKFLLFCSVSI